MELSLGLGSGYDIYDKQRKDEKHEIDDGTQIMTVTFKGYDRHRLLFIRVTHSFVSTPNQNLQPNLHYYLKKRF